MAARTTQYAESLAASTTTSTTPQTKVTLTFTPTASTKYYFFWSCRAGNSTATTNRCQVRFRDNTGGTNFNTPERANFNTANRYSFFGGYAYTASGSPVSTDFVLQWNNNTGTDTENIQDARILAIQAGSNDVDASSDTESTTTSTSFQTKTTLTFTPPSTGDYLIFAFAEILIGSTLGTVSIKLDKGGTTYGAGGIRPKTTSDYIAWGTFVKLNLTNISQTFTIQYHSDSGVNTAKIRNARIIALRLADMNNAYYGETRARSSTTSVTYVDVATLTQTPNALEHILFGCQVTDGGSGGVPADQKVLEGGTDITTNTSNFGTTSTTDIEPMFAVWRETLAASSTTWKTQVKANGSGISNVGYQEAAIAVLQTAANNTYIDVPLGSLSLAGQVPSVNTGTSIAVPLGSLSLSGQTPAIDHSIPVPLGSLVLSGMTPTKDMAIPVPLKTLAVSAQTPAIATGCSVSVPLGSLSLSGMTPAIDLAVLVPLGNLTLTGMVPAYGAANTEILVPLLTLSLTGPTPSVAAGAMVPVPLASLSLAGMTPAIDHVIPIPLGNLSLLGMAPAIDHVIPMPLGSLSLSGQTPAIDHAIPIPLSTLSLLSNTPNVATGASVNIPVATFFLNPMTPAMDHAIPIPLKTLSLTALAPGLPIYIDVPLLTLHMTPLAPTIATGVSVAVPLLSLSLTAFPNDFTRLNIPYIPYTLRRSVGAYRQGGVLVIKRTMDNNVIAPKNDFYLY